MNSSTVAQLLAGLQASNAPIATLLAQLTPETPDVAPEKPGMPEQLAASWKSYPGKGVAHHVRESDGRVVDIRGAYAKAPRKTKRAAAVASAAPAQSRVESVAQREREQIAEARRIEQLYRAGQLTQKQAIELAYHEIGKKRATAMMQ